MKIKENYIPKAKRLQKLGNHETALYQRNTEKCPLCKREIPVKEINRHVRIELLDPRWREQKEREASKKRPSNLLVDNGADVAKHLNKLADIRKDIFGGDEMEAERKIKETREKAKLQLNKAWVGVKVDNPGAFDNSTKKAGKPNNPLSGLSYESVYNNVHSTNKNNL